VSDDCRNCYPHNFMNFYAVPRLVWWVQCRMSKVMRYREVEFWELLFQRHAHMDGSGLDIVSYRTFLLEEVKKRGSNRFFQLLVDRIGMIDDYRTFKLRHEIDSVLLDLHAVLPTVLLNITVSYVLPTPYWQQTKERRHIVDGLNNWYGKNAK